MGDGAAKSGGGPGPVQEAPRAEESPSFLPRRLTPNQLFGSGRGDHVVAEREAAACQIQRTLRVWRKAAGVGDEHKKDKADEKEGAEVSEPGEPAEKEADAVADDLADKLHGGDKKDSKGGKAKDGKSEGKESDGEKKDGEGKDGAAGGEKAPKIAAKLEGIGRKIFLSGDDSARDRGQHENYKKDLRREMAKPTVKDPELKKLIDAQYREGAKVGSGSTAAAIREEKAKGVKVGGKEHTQTGQDAIVALQRWLKAHPKADPGDTAAAENVIKDLEDALK